MASKDRCIYLKDKQDLALKNSPDIYNNFTLIKSHKCITAPDHKRSKSVEIGKRKSLNYVLTKALDVTEKRTSQKDDISLKTFYKICSKDTFNTNYNDDKKETKKFSSSNKSSSSTLSLHIAAYENFVEARFTDPLADKEFKKNDKTLIQNPEKQLDRLEFPRQQENEPFKPEVQQFAASQKLFTPLQEPFTSPNVPQPLVAQMPRAHQPEWLLKFDHFYFAELPKKKKSDKKAFGEFVKNVKAVLTRGWDGRVEEMEIYNAGINPSTKNQRALIGVKLTADWDKAITKGPEANTPEAKEFRSFYGEKSEMRKLLDGSIREAVIWYNSEDPTSSAIKKQILATIANFVLAKHYAPVKIHFRHFNWNKLVTEISEYGKCSSAFETLATAIRDIKGFPLAVSTIYCTSPFYRRTEAFPPLDRFLFTNSKASNVGEDGVARIALKFEDDAMDGTTAVAVRHAPYFTPALSVMLTLEHSNKFGDTPQIIAKFKTAFYIELAQRLKDDHSIFAVATEKNLYVTIDNIAFDVEIGQTKEIAIAKRLENENKHALIPVGGDWKTLKHKIEFLPQMSNQITGLTHRFSAFAETCQLFKKFLASHFLLEHFDDIAVELIVANVFLTLDSERGNPPLDPFSGFTHILHLLTSHDFARQPLFIDFNGNLDSEKKEAMMKHFINARPVLPPLILFTSDDESGIRFTKNGPEMIVFSRLLEISSCALLIIKKHLEGVIDTNLKSIFFSQMEGFDVVIELHKEAICFGSFGYNSGKEIISKMKKPKLEGILPIVNFNPPMKLLDELKVYFGNIALFFYDRYGGKSIGVLFRPDFKKSSAEYKVNRTYCRKNTKEGLTPNIEEFMETVQILGAGIVSNVTLCQK